MPPGSPPVRCFFKIVKVETENIGRNFALEGKAL